MSKRLTKKEIELLEMTKSEKAVEYFKDKSNLGKIAKPDVFIDFTGPCGESMKLYLRIERGCIEDVKFQYKGCSGLACCGSALCKMIKGKTVKEARKVTQNDILDHLKASPIEDFDCPLLAVKTLERAVKQFEQTKLSQRRKWLLFNDLQRIE